MDDPAAFPPQPDPEIIEGGNVEPFSDPRFEERKHRAATARVLAYYLLGLLAVARQFDLGVHLHIPDVGLGTNIANAWAL